MLNDYIEVFKILLYNNVIVIEDREKNVLLFST